jgi:predicted permease
MSWKYLPVFNSCLQLLITTLFGAVMAKFVPSVFDQTFVSKAVAFVFHVALPCHVLKGIGTKVDFYSETFIWKYIIAFLILRFFALVIAAGSFLLSGKCSKVGIGEITVRWLSLTWISTVILGVPILTAVFNNPGRGLFYGLLAGISSFIFQLPFQLFFFECHKLEREHIEQQGREMEDRDTDEENIVPKESVVKNNQGDEINESVNHWTFWAGLCTSSTLWRDIFKRVFTNPIVVAILCAFIISLSTLGKVLDEIEGLKFFVDTLGYLGQITTPLSLFAMGIWMHHQGRNLVRIGFVELFIFMITKLIIVPMIMIGLAKALSLDDESGRAAVLIASLPISMASFTLGSIYDIGKDQLSANVAVGTLLMLPTVIVWNLVLDELDLFVNFVK